MLGVRHILTWWTWFHLVLVSRESNRTMFFLIMELNGSFFKIRNQIGTNHLVLVWFVLVILLIWKKMRKNIWGRRIAGWGFNFKNPRSMMTELDGKWHATVGLQSLCINWKWEKKNKKLIRIWVSKMNLSL